MWAKSVGTLCLLLSHSLPAQSIEDYDRAQYVQDGWGDADGDCINTRHEVLIIESLVPVTLSSGGCFVDTGKWRDPATDQVFTDPREVDIDHHVPLAEAHRSGASLWSPEQKQAFANDMLLAPALMAMDDYTNRRLKSAKDPAQWLPPNSEYHCDYVRNWVEVKEAYELNYDSAEREAIESVLGTVLENGARQRISAATLDGAPTAASFGLGLRGGKQCGYVATASFAEPLELTLDIRPDAGDLHEEINIYVVAEVGNTLFVLTPFDLLPWSGMLSDLVPYISSLTFAQSETFTLFSGTLGGPETFKIYVAYGTPTKLVYSPVAFEVIIE